MTIRTHRRTALLAAVAATLGFWPRLPRAARTGKERLSDKASDEQRVDDCKVPAARRGSSHRPTACARDVTS